MPGMDMGGATNVVSAVAVNTAIPSVGPTPTDYILYNILYPTGTVRAQGTAQATTGSGSSTPAVSSPSATLPPIATAAAATVSAGGSASAAQFDTPLNGDPVNGKTVFSQNGCSGCHNVASDTVIVGPALKGIAIRAAARRPGYSAIAYLRESIVSPNAYVVPGFNGSIMPQTFNQQLTKQQIDDVVAYLLTLKN